MKMPDLEFIENAAKDGEDIFAEAVALGQDAVDASDRNRITIGALAGLVERRYNEQSVRKFADEIGAGEKAVRQYQRVVDVLGRATCVEILDDGILKYSHMRAAIRTGSRDAALALLQTAAREGWTVRETEVKAGKGTNAWLTLVDLERAELRSVDYRRGEVTLFVGDATDRLQDRIGEFLKVDIRAKAKEKEAQRDIETAG